jgi:hypothetical protein
MKEKSVKFELEHLDRYCIVDKPCTIIVKNNSKLDFNKLYSENNNPRWILNLKVIAKANINLLIELDRQKKPVTYYDMGHLLMTGVIWEEQVKGPVDLPSKGEELIAVFDYVDEVLRCTNITLIPRFQPELYLHSSAMLNEINEFEKIIKNMGNE